MRLVNADKYCEFLNTYLLEKAQNNFMSFYRDALQKTFEFEVKAIPIEWIEAFAEKIWWEDERAVIEDMVERWEKENDKGSE